MSLELSELSRCDAKRIERPSGDQATCPPSPTPDRSTTREPSTSTMNILASPERLELKAIRLPSGDHDGYSPPSVWGKRRCPDPSAFKIPIQLMPEGPPGSAYAIIEPSGDQVSEAAVRGQSVLPRSIGIHQPQLGIFVGFGSICDEATVGRQRRVEFVPGRVSESPQVRAVSVDGPHIVVIGEDDPPGEGGDVD